MGHCEGLGGPSGGAADGDGVKAGAVGARFLVFAAGASGGEKILAAWAGLAGVRPRVENQSEYLGFGIVESVRGGGLSRAVGAAGKAERNGELGAFKAASGNGPIEGVEFRGRQFDAAAWSEFAAAGFEDGLEFGSRVARDGKVEGQKRGASGASGCFEGAAQGCCAVGMDRRAGVFEGFFEAFGVGFGQRLELVNGKEGIGLAVGAAKADGLGEISGGRRGSEGSKQARGFFFILDPDGVQNGVHGGRLKFFARHSLWGNLKAFYPVGSRRRKAGGRLAAKGKPR